MVGGSILFTYLCLTKLRIAVKYFLSSLLGGLLACTLGLFSVADASVGENYSANANVSVTQLRSGEHANFSRVVLDTTDQVNVKYDTSPDGKTIAIVIPRVKWKARNTYTYLRSKNIDRIEFVPAAGGGGSLLIEGKRQLGLRWIRGLKPSGKYGHRLAFDVVPKTSRTLPSKATVIGNAVRDAKGQAVQSVLSAAPTSVKKVASGHVISQASQKIPTLIHTKKMVGNIGSARMDPYIALKSGFFFASDGSLDLDDPAASHNVETDAPFTSGVFSGAFGISWASYGLPLRNEFEFTYRMKADTDITTTNRTSGVAQAGTAEISSVNFMLNSFYDFQTHSKFSPFIGLGLGVSQNELEVSTTLDGASQTYESDASIGFAYSLMAGAGYRVSPRWLVDFVYRYIDSGSLRTALGSGGNTNRRFDRGGLRSHDIMLGLRYGI